MLALFVGVVTLLRYDTGDGYMIFSIGWLSAFDLPVYFLLGASFILCACICYPVGQLCGKLLHSSNSLKAYSLNLIGSILGVVALFVMSLYWLPPVIWFARSIPIVFAGGGAQPPGRRAASANARIAAALSCGD